MEFVLMGFAGAGLVGCFGAVLRIDLSRRGSRTGRHMSRPQRSVVARESAAQAG